MHRLFEKAMLWEMVDLQRNPMQLVAIKGHQQTAEEAADSYGRAVLHSARIAASTISGNGRCEPMSRVAGSGGVGIALGGHRSRTSGHSSV